MIDGTTLGAIMGFLGLVVTSAGGVYVATRTNSSEKENSALKALEETRDEATEARITLRDEQILRLQEQLADCKAENRLKIEELENEIDRLHSEIRDLKKGAVPDGAT